MLSMQRMKGRNAQRKTLTYFLIGVRIKPDSRLYNFSDTRVWKQVRACVWGTALMELFSFWIYGSRLCKKESSFAVLRCFLEKIFPPPVSRYDLGYQQWKQAQVWTVVVCLGDHSLFAWSSGVGFFGGRALVLLFSGSFYHTKIQIKVDTG